MVGCMIFRASARTASDSSTIETDTLPAYYAEGATWDHEIYGSAIKWRDRWCLIAMVSLGLAVALVLALMTLLPLKTTKFVVIETDKQSGLVTVKAPLEPNGQVSEVEAITKYWIADYITRREGYLFQRAEHDYTVVQSFSTDRVAKVFHDYFAPQENPDSPVNVYGKSAQINVKIRSISFIREDTALARITTETVEAARTRENYLAVTLSFEYINTPRDEAERFINPLGFMVTAYRADPEIIHGGDE